MLHTTRTNALGITAAIASVTWQIYAGTLDYTPVVQVTIVL